MGTTLEFNKIGELYVAETTVTENFMLHLDRKQSGRIYMWQRASEDVEYAPCDIGEYIGNNIGLSFEHSFISGVYPDGGLHIKVESESEVTKGVIYYSANNE